MLSPHVPAPLAVAALCSAVVAGATTTVTAPAEKRTFNLPRGDAADTLKHFAAAAGTPIVYLVDRVRGATTNAVSGEFTPREALERMLAGSGLEAAQDAATGALVVSRKRLAEVVPSTGEVGPASDPQPKTKTTAMTSKPRTLLAAFVNWLAVSTAVDAQNPLAGQKDETITLSPFAVNTARDIGYVASSTLAGTRFNTQLRDTPAALSIFTADFLSDIGVTSVREAYEYGLNSATSTSDVTGNPQQSSDITLQIRGLNNASLGRNYFAWNNNSDVYNTERLTFARGPNSVIFGIGGPGGIINTDTKRAVFTSKREFQFRVGSYDDFRATVDLNERLHEKLAVRVNVLWQDKDGWRDYEFERRKAVALAGTWRPFPKTSVRIDAETMRLAQNKPLNWGLFDGVTPWVAAGRPLSQIAGGGAPAGTSAAGSTHNNYFVTNTNEVRRLNGTRTTTAPAMPAAVATITNTWVLRDFSIVPRSRWAMGPGNDSFSDFDTAGLFVEQELMKGLFFEAAANVQHRTSLWARPVNWNELTLRADASAFRPDGSINPFAGQYFIDGAMIQDQRTNVWNTDYRATMSYQADFGKWLGRHQIAGLVSRREDENYTTTHAMLNVGNPSVPGDALNVNNRIIYRTYLSLSGENPLNLPNHVGNPFTSPVNSGGVVSGLLRNGANNGLTRIDTRLLATQSSWWDGRLVATAGLRGDEQDAYGSTPVLASNRVVVNATRRTTPNSSRGTTRTFGAVFHLLPSLGIYYNNADNFTPQSGVAWGVDFQQRNTPQGNRQGEGQDMGLKYSLFSNRVVGTLGYYETSETNSNKAPLTRFNEGIASIYSALKAPFLAVGGNDVTDFVSHGLELDLTANLTPNWRMQFNAQRSISAESNIWPWQTRFLEENLARFRANATVPVTDNVNGTNIGLITDFVAAVLGEAKAVASQGQLGHGRYSANLFTNYTFTEGRLRGFSAGLGVKLRGPQVAGLNAAKLIAWRGEHTLVDATFGYSRKLSGVKRPVRFQINITNLFNNETLIPTLSDGVVDYRWQFLRPRTISLTTSVKL